MENLIHSLNGLVWGIPMLTLLLGTGLYLTIGLRFLSVTRLPYAFKQLFKKPDSNDEGDVTPFGALMTALSSTIGTGNIAGVAAAIAIGGPGAVFWMWMTAIVGTATKYSEGVLAVKWHHTYRLGCRPVGRRSGRYSRRHPADCQRCQQAGALHGAFLPGGRPSGRCAEY